MSAITPTVVGVSELPGYPGAARFEGAARGAQISMFLNQTPPGGGSQLHVHPYEETFVIEEGTVTFEVDGQVINAAAGQIVVVPPDAPHKFMNTGERTLRKVSIHPVPKAITYWLEK